jgi:putative SOS response-associated peptidase YedK
VTDRFVSYRTGPAIAAGEPGAVIRRTAGGVIEMVNLIWGLAPGEAGGRPFTTLRAEGRRFGSRRCLIPASEFFVGKGRGEERRRWRFSLVSGDFFYFAGIWRPAEHGRAPSYAILTIAANPDVAPFHDRQMAAIRRPDRIAWLDHEMAERSLLAPLPAGTFHVEQVEGPPPEAVLFDWGKGGSDGGVVVRSNSAPVAT